MGAYHTLSTWPQELGALHSSPTLPNNRGYICCKWFISLDLQCILCSLYVPRIVPRSFPIRFSLNGLIFCLFLLGALSNRLVYADYVKSTHNPSTGYPHNSTSSRAGMYDRRDTTHISKSLNVHDVPNFERLADAIFKAEKSKNHPYGILAPYCTAKTPEKCRKGCLQTIAKRHRMWLETKPVATDSGAFISYLARSYAPLNAKNDPSGLNHNWVSNVRSLYGKSV
jgi:hypothetical protein